ncbi:unnamed protein product [Closterium sp. NIES-53]
MGSSLPEVPDPESDRARAASPTVSRLLATAVTYPSFESAAASALVAELLDFCYCLPSRLRHLVLCFALLLVLITPHFGYGGVSECYSTSPSSVGGECGLGTDVLEDKQEDFDCFAAAVPRFASMLLAPDGDPDAPDIPTPRSYAEAIMGPYSSQSKKAIDAEMASWKVKRPPGSPPAFKARYVAQCEYELHSLDFSTAFLQGSLHEEIWLRRSLGFTGKWNDTLRNTLAALGFAPSTADPSLFLRTDTSLLPFYVLVYVVDLVFAIAYTEALTLVKSELQKRHTCTDLVLQRFGVQFSSPQPTPLSTGHSLSAPPSDESIEPSGLYPELVGCLITSGMGLVLGGRGPVVTQTLLGSSCEAEIYVVVTVFALLLLGLCGDFVIHLELALLFLTAGKKQSFRIEDFGFDGVLECGMRRVSESLLPNFWFFVGGGAYVYYEGSIGGLAKFSFGDADDVVSVSVVNRVVGGWEELWSWELCCFWPFESWESLHRNVMIEVFIAGDQN